MDRFAGSRIILTGGASGIGYATVHRLVDEGATVFAIDRSTEGLERVKSEASDPGRVITHTADLAEEANVVAAAAAGIEQLGGVDVLVNGAGTMKPDPARKADLDINRHLLAVNYLAPVAMCREVLPHLPDGSGVIINVTSTSATRAHPGMTAYAASKGALLAYSISLAAELAPRRIRVVPVSPGGVATPLSGAVATGEEVDLSWYGRIMPLWGELGQPNNIAATIAYAASADGAFLNGVEMRVDGGSHT